MFIDEVIMDYNDKNDFIWQVDNYEKNKKGPSSCVECGRCVDRCPQGINVPLELKKMKDEAMKLKG